MPEPEILSPSDEVSITHSIPHDSATESEINRQIQFAMDHPRSITKVRKELKELVTLDKSIAEESFYTLKRKDKNGNVKLIQGPSIRFAEVLCYVWGHVRWQKQISDVDAEFVTGEGIFMDLERNIVGKVRTKRRITDSNGRRYNADMIQTTGNASASLAYRNAVTGTVPQALWKDVLEEAKVVAIGGTQSIGEKRIAAIQYGAKIGVSEQQIYDALGVQGINDLGVDELISLKGLFNSLKDGEMTLEEAFGDPFEKEVNGLFEKLGFNQARRASLRENYRGKSSDLLAYLKKQAEPLENTETTKAEVKAEQKPVQQETKPEPEQKEAQQSEPAGEAPKRGRGRPPKTPTPPPQEQLGMSGIPENLEPFRPSVQERTPDVVSEQVKAAAPTLEF